MKAEATEVARQILQAGGNAFDAAVGGQAALAVTDFALNGVGSDAVLLVYDAREKKVLSINAEPRAPKLATIEWYERNNGGKIPGSDGLLSGGLPGVVDAWYILLGRWGTMSFEQVLQPAIDLAENGFPLSEDRARMIASSEKIRKYPSTVKVYLPNGEAPKAGEIFRNPDLARTLKKLVEAEQANKGKGRREALKAARDRFYTGDIAREMAAFSEANGGLFRYEDFADYSAKVETPISFDYRGYRVYKNPSSSQGPTELIALNLLEGYDLKSLGHNSADFIHTNVEVMAAAGTIFIVRKVFARKAEQIFYAMFLILIATFYLAFVAYFGVTTAWPVETAAVVVFVAVGLLGARLPFALVAGYSLHGLWDLLHELQVHVSFLDLRQLTATPLAYGFCCAAIDFCLAGYFYVRREEWITAWKSLPE